MKIVHIITRMILGGAQENTLLTCEGLHRRGHELALITGPSTGPEGQLMDRARTGGYRIVELSCLRRAINPFQDVPGYFELKKQIARLDPDIVHTHSAKGGVLGRWAAYTVRSMAAKSCCPAADAFNQARADLCARPRIVHTIHGLAFHPYLSAAKNRFYIAVERAAAKRTDLFISVADAMTHQALAAGIGRAEQFVTIYSGLETDLFLNPPPAERLMQIRDELNIPRGATVIASLARLAEFKGHDYIIAAATKLADEFPDAYWLFIGDGYLRSQIEQQIAAAGLQNRFRLTGLVAPERVGSLLHASDILVHCSLREGLARALPQAMLAGKPVISFDVDGAAEVVINNQTGLLIPPREVDALIAAQRTLLADSVLRGRLGQAGRELCRKEFDHNLMVEKIEQAYRSILPKVV
jgi:glycosyltransferase involved in cell wall biosynthesis